MIIKVKVNTNSAKEEIVKLENQSYVVKFKAVREKGKANIRLQKLLADFFHLPLSSVKIQHGHKSSTKIIELVEE